MRHKRNRIETLQVLQIAVQRCGNILHLFVIYLIIYIRRRHIASPRGSVTMENSGGAGHFDGSTNKRSGETSSGKLNPAGAGSEKRENYLSWDDYFMATAFLSAQRSKDPSTQVGATIVNEDNKIVGMGYNGMPIGCHDDIMYWGKDSDHKLKNKYLYVCHAELNAVLNSNTVGVKNCRMYVCLFPCNECAKVIIQSGIKEVIYYSDKYSKSETTMASKDMLRKTQVKLRQYRPERKQIIIDFGLIDESGNQQLSPPIEESDAAQQQ